MDALLKRIAVDPGVMTGKPVIRGTRITVEAILQRLYGGMSEPDILRDFPHITLEDIKAAQLYALEVVRNEDVLVE
jgi:uncharacterized protein (DUF433 family)